MVLLKPVPGQEAGNAAFLAREGAAVVARGTGDAVEHVRRLLADAKALATMAENARRLYRPGTETIVQAVRRAVAAPTPPPSR
jgi:UDP-N-acetylglucosamine:LPS N-acetylglucosamine transferase